MTAQPRILLVSLRDASDAMAGHEWRCFARACGVAPERVDVHPMIEGRPPVATLRGYDAVLFGGSGAYSVLDDTPWIRQGIEVMLELVGLRVRCWASCFGFQGLAVALGGELVSDPARVEMGSTLLTLTEAGRTDPLMGLLPASFWAQEGHKDTVVRLPDGVDLLASGERVHAQAFKVCGAPFWASQFHPELRVCDTVDRFRHYHAEYLPGSDPGPKLVELAAGAESPELALLLPKLVRGEL